MDFNFAWLHTIRNVLNNGLCVSPRGQLTREIPQHTVVVDMRRPVLRVPDRKLSYRFMAAEAYWILSGDNTVAGIAPYNAVIANFSDDGRTFFGAYGPKIADQLQYVVNKLKSDPGTRQAGLTIWRENPPDTKDVPCTVAIFFGLRGGLLNAHVFMRSSDIWLGLPYDTFNFSMLAHLVCAKLNEHVASDSPVAVPGQLFLTAASSHLYQHQWDAAAACLESKVLPQPATPKVLWNDHVGLMDWLAELRSSSTGDDNRWWEHDSVSGS